MQLTDWLTAKNESIRSLAAKWGQTRSPLWRAATGKTFPSFELVVRAFVETGGKVGLSDWIELNRERLIESGVLPKGWKAKK